MRTFQNIHKAQQRNHIHNVKIVCSTMITILFLFSPLDDSFNLDSTVGLESKGWLDTKLPVNPKLLCHVSTYVSPRGLGFSCRLSARLWFRSFNMEHLLDHGMKLNTYNNKQLFIRLSLNHLFEMQCSQNWRIVVNSSKGIFYNQVGSCGKMRVVDCRFTASTMPWVCKGSAQESMRTEVVKYPITKLWMR